MDARRRFLDETGPLNYYSGNWFREALTDARAFRADRVTARLIIPKHSTCISTSARAITSARCKEHEPWPTNWTTSVNFNSAAPHVRPSALTLRSLCARATVAIIESEREREKMNDVLFIFHIICSIPKEHRGYWRRLTFASASEPASRISMCARERIREETQGARDVIDRFFSTRHKKEKRKKLCAASLPLLSRTEERETILST